ncbi:MAG: DUF2795 domain-containing protein [Alphaproteobacteria bacterium]|jgi:hypothetical protein
MYKHHEDMNDEQTESKASHQEESWKASRDYLEKMQFPADKKTLLEQAKEIRAPSDVLTFLGRLTDKTYESLEDLWESAKKPINH